MHKFAENLTAALLALVVLAGGIVGVMHFGFGIAIFDQSGWNVTETGRTQYLDYRGDPLLRWQLIDGSWYYFAPADGTMVTGWLEEGGEKYYLDDNGTRHSGWLETENGRCYLAADGRLAAGWTDTDEGRFYMDENGCPTHGWLRTEEGTYYLDDIGTAILGWLEQDGSLYYFREDGTMAVGKVIVDGVARYFSSTGAYVPMVNKWNPVPEDYQVDLVTYKGWSVDRSCYDALKGMLSDLENVGYYEITSAYRSTAAQQSIWDTRFQRYMNSGYSPAGAEEKVALEVAIPGTSEHHLGLAVDISAGDTVDAWLADNSWRYGFILRYPNEKAAITGIIYEPWHFRYVGPELAQEMYELGLCLEEYMDMLTQQQGTGAGTASDPERYTSCYP